MARRRHLSFERDYSFYLKNADRFTFAGTDVKRDRGVQYDGDSDDTPYAVPFSKNGSDAKACFFALDSRGRCGPCREPRELVRILTCKAAVNLQIKMWAAGMAEGTLFDEELEEYVAHFGAPAWVSEAVRKQAARIKRLAAPTLALS